MDNLTAVMTQVEQAEELLIRLGLPIRHNHNLISTDEHMHPGVCCCLTRTCMNEDACNINRVLVYRVRQLVQASSLTRKGVARALHIELVHSGGCEHAHEWQRCTALADALFDSEVL